MQIQAIERNRNQIFFRFVDQSRVSAEQLLNLVARNKRASFSPQGLLTLETGELTPTGLFDALHKILDQIRI